LGFLLCNKIKEPPDPPFPQRIGLFCEYVGVDDRFLHKVGLKPVKTTYIGPRLPCLVWAIQMGGYDPILFVRLVHVLF